jgi:hypothetical protein
MSAEQSDSTLTELVEAAMEWREVVGGTLTVPPKAYLDAEGRLASAVDAYVKANGVATDATQESSHDE